jgi:hypothetical protein
MQAVGGVRGTNIWSGTLIGIVTGSAPDLFPNSTNSSRHADLETLAAKYRPLWVDPQVNFRDSIRKDDKSQTPRQFVYEAADCRIFYQPHHTFDMSELWNTVYEVAWEGGRCAYGAGYEPLNYTSTNTTMGWNRSSRLSKRRQAAAQALLRDGFLEQQWKKLVTRVPLIKDMGAFQLP